MPSAHQKVQIFIKLLTEWPLVSQRTLRFLDFFLSILRLNDCQLIIVTSISLINSVNFAKHQGINWLFSHKLTNFMLKIPWMTKCALKFII